MSSLRNHNTARTLVLFPSRPKLKLSVKKKCTAKQHWRGRGAHCDSAHCDSAQIKPEQMEACLVASKGEERQTRGKELQFKV